MPPSRAALLTDDGLVLFVLALLISDTAAGLAGRLTGSLALAAAAVLSAVAKITGLNGLDVFHDRISFKIRFQTI